MSSPRKFAEKIALIQQKQAEGDAAFNTILNEVEAAKHSTDRLSTSKSKSAVSKRKYEASNGMINSDNYHFANQPIKVENNNGCDRLLLPPDNASWRRTHSDSSLHQSMMPQVIAHYNAQQNNNNNENNNQQLNFDSNDVKYDPQQYPSSHHQHLQVSNSQFPQQPYFDLNNNNNYSNGRTNMFYPPTQQGQTIPQQTLMSSNTNNTYTQLGPRYSGGINNSNVLMLPPNQYPRGGGSLPDLRVGNGYNNQPTSFSTVPSPPTSTAQQFFRSPSPQQTSDGDLYVLGPQRQLPSSIGPLKSPTMRRRHSPIGDVKQASPRRQNSPSPDVQSGYRVDPQSPQSQSSYSPQNSPHLLASPANEHAPFSPQQQQQQLNDNLPHYTTLPNYFDRINLDNNFFNQQPPPSPSKHNSLPTTPGIPNDHRQMNYYPQFTDDLQSSFNHGQPTVNSTLHINQRSPTIPNIFVIDPDSSKLDLSKELANDFSNPFDSLIDPIVPQMNPDDEDFFLNTANLSVDPTLCDDGYRMER